MNTKSGHRRHGFFSDGIADFITELAETVEQNAPGKAHTSNHFAEYETLGFDYLKAASGFVDYPGIGFYPGYGNRESMEFGFLVHETDC